MVFADISKLDNAKLHQEIRVPLTISSTSDQAYPNIQCYLLLSRNNRNVEKVSIVTESPQKQIIVVSPQQQGRHMLGVTVNAQHIEGSPFHFEVEVPLLTSNRKSPVGLTTSLDEVFLVEQERKGIAVFKNLKETGFINLGRMDIVEIAVHKKTGNIFVSTGETGKVLKLERKKKGKKGKLIDSTDLPDDGFPEYFSNGLSINSKDELYVCDTPNHRVIVFDLDFKHLRTITGKEHKEPFNCPRHVEFDENDNVYISEKKRIQILSHNGKYMGKVKISNAVCLKICGSFIFVTDEGEACVSIYSVANKTPIRDIYKDNTKFDGPRGLTVDNNGYVYVTTIRGKMLIL